MSLNFFTDEESGKLFSLHLGILLFERTHQRNTIVEDLVQEDKRSVLQKYQNYRFYLHIDDTTEPDVRKILNILEISLTRVNSPIYLLESAKIDRTNSENVVRHLDIVLGTLRKNALQNNRFKALITNCAAYSVKI